MCTVSIVPLTDGLRLVCNRDESRLRAIARPPEIVDVDGVRVVMPTDPDSDGTWIAGSEQGVAFAVLNLNIDLSRAAPPIARSRGGIIPQLLMCHSVDEATAALERLPRDAYRPFRLIVAAAGVVADLRQSPPFAFRQLLTAPLMFTSSGLGDHLVDAPRRELFDRIMAEGEAGPSAWPEKQDRFHAHQWPAQRHISVTMERPEASTVSRTVLQIEGDRVHMEYSAVGQKRQNVTVIELYRSQRSR